MDLKHKHWAIVATGTLIGVFLVITGWYAFGSPSALAPGPEATTSPTMASSTPAAATHITEHAAYYDIDLTYPSATPFSGTNPAADAAAVASMRAAMQETADTFKKDGNFANLTHDDVQIMGLDQRKEALSSEYKTHTGTHTVSYVFEIYEDTLGAHPNVYYRTFTFDTHTGAAVALTDLFSSPSYLTTLSDAARAGLPGVIAHMEQVAVSEVDTDYIREGTAPTAENFAWWYLDGTTLTLLFPPYQVGPHSLGTVLLPFPLSGRTDLRAGY